MEKKKITKRFDIDPASFKGSIDALPPVATPEQTQLIKDFYQTYPELSDLKKDDKSSDAWIQTFMGKKFYPQHPTNEMIDIFDIAHALSQQCRFTGHSSQHYSVAQHCVLVSYLCKPENALCGLLHDASEAYISDLSSPIKKLPELAGYRELEQTIRSAIYRKFGLAIAEPADVKYADLMVLAIEANSVLGMLHQDWKLPIEMPSWLQITAMLPTDAEDVFLFRFNRLYGV